MTKTFWIIVAAVLLGVSNTAYAGIIDQGETVEVSFASLPYLESTQYLDTTKILFPVPWAIHCDFTGSCTYETPASGSYRLDLYENRSDSVAYFSSVYNVGYNMLMFSRPMSIVIGEPEPIMGNLLWEDLEGRLTLTMLTGSMEINSLGIRVASGGYVCGTDFITTPTPVPAAAWLLGSGLVGLIGLRRKTNNAA